MAEPDTAPGAAPAPAAGESAASDEQARAAQLRGNFHAQTARISFVELQRPFAAGCLVLVNDDLDLVDVAVDLALDRAERFQAWISSGSLRAVSDEQAAQWLADEQSVWAVVANPWVLVQLGVERRRTPVHLEPGAS